MFVRAENAADTSASRDSDLIEKPTRGISHELIEEKIKMQENSACTFPTVYARTQQTQARRAHPVMKRNCQQGKSGVPDCRPTLFLVGGYISIHGEQLDTIDSTINKKKCKWQ